jgi:hypothetical protein
MECFEVRLAGFTELGMQQHCLKPQSKQVDVSGSGEAEFTFSK